MPMPSGLIAGREWRRKIALSILPWLFSLAKDHRRPIFYSEVDAEVVARGIHTSTFDTNYGGPLGNIGDALREISNTLRDEIPPLNALVIGKETLVPGHGCQQYILRYRNASSGLWVNLSREDQRAITEEVHEDIFTYPHWDRVEAYFSDVLQEFPELSAFEGVFLTPLHDAARRRTRATTERPLDPDFVPTERGTGEESLVGLPKTASADIEHTYGTGDRVDVEFRDGAKRLAVEVKSVISSEEDVIRGLFQCIKYRYLCRAHQKLDGVMPNGDALLVVARKVTPLVKEYARILNVRYIHVPQPESNVQSI
jgi:hypothetical protein